MERITRREFLQIMGAVAGTAFVAPAFPVSEQPADASGHAEFLGDIAASHDWEAPENFKQDFWVEIDGKRVDNILNIQLVQSHASTIPSSLVDSRIIGDFVHDPDSPLAGFLHHEHELALVCDDQRVAGKVWMTSHALEVPSEEWVTISVEWLGNGPFK